VSRQVRGPPAKAAFDAAGKPTKALEGFCRKNGASVDAVLREADAKGVEYCWVEVKDAGKPAAEVGDLHIGMLWFSIPQQ
jgi:glycyl-tRNA synthetase